MQLHCDSQAIGRVTVEYDEHLISPEFNARKILFKDCNGRITFSIQNIF